MDNETMINKVSQSSAPLRQEVRILVCNSFRSRVKREMRYFSICHLFDLSADDAIARIIQLPHIQDIFSRSRVKICPYFELKDIQVLVFTVGVFITGMWLNPLQIIQYTHYK